MTYPFISMSHQFEIQVRTEFDFEQSNPMLFHYLFKYTINIKNLGERSAQLISRKWFIKDNNQKMNLVEGPGVIGKTPYFKPGDAFEYESFCPLPTLEGEMWGHFNMVDDQGNEFKIETPHFKFKVPDELIDIY